ncbi:sporulation-induced protein [Coemansia sp. S100]|nr:sporulation-induced protein [Coemansia sp. S100]
MLVDRLGPGCDPETHSLAAQVLLDIIAISQCNNPSQPTIGANALIEELKSEATVTRLANFMLDRDAPHATSTLINCVYIFIELIRRNYSDTTTVTAGDSPISPDTDQQESPDQSSHGGSTPRMPNVDLSDMMRVLAERTGDLVALLKNPRSPTAPVPTTQGMREPLGFERLRICELFAELLHCSNMPRLNQSVSSPLLEASPVSHRDSPTVAVAATTSEGCGTPHGSDIAEYAFADGAASVYSDVALVVSEAKDHDSSNTAVGQLLKWKLIEHGVLTTCVELFFEFGLNNFLHSVVYDIMHQVLNLPLSLECNVALIVVAFRDVRITSRIAQACANNDFVCRQPRGIRLGYMGHLTGIGEEVARLLELSGAALEPLIAPYIDGDEWLDYVARTLQEVRDRDQQPLGGERPGGANNDSVLGDIDDSGVSELGGNSNQVFVSRMGLVDPSSNESYGPEDDEDDDDDEEELDDDSEYSRRGFGGDRGYHTSTSMYPNEEDDESGIDYVNHSRLYFNPSVTRDDEDQFIIKDDDDDDGDLADDTVDDSDNHARDIGPAERIGRYRSHQNEHPLSTTTSDDKKAAADPVVVVEEEDDDDDGASEMGRMNDFLRNRAADLAEAARNNQSTTSGKKQYGRSLSNTTEEEEEEGRRQVIRLSFDGSADTVTGYDQTLLPSYLLSLSNHSNGPPPETPPRPTPQQTMAFVPPPLPNFLPPAISKLKAKQQAAALNGGEPKGRLQDLLYRESKQRSLSSSELDNIVPADISTSTAPITEDSDGRGRSGSFAARRQRSRSQSAGVGISREMVIQAASQGQFPYLDANTCEFVGQLKSDTVKMGGAAANGSSSSGSRQRSNTAAGSVRGSVSSSPTVKPVRESNGMRACSLPQSGLRYLDDLSDDGDLDLSGVNIDDDGSVAMTVPDTLRIDTTMDDRRRNRRSKAIDALPGFPTLPLSPIHKSSPILQFSPPTSPPARGHAMMAPAVDDDESMDWADFSTFTTTANDIDDFVPLSTTGSTKRKSPFKESRPQADIEQLTDMLQVLDKQQKH